MTAVSSPKKGKFSLSDQNTRVPGVPPIPSTQLPIQAGVGAPTAAGGGHMRAPVCLELNLKYEI